MDSLDLQFYKLNKDKSFNLDPLPDGSVVEQAKWIMQQQHIGWLELDNQHPLEVNYTKYYKHRGHEKHQGWSSVCLHGLGEDKVATADSYGLDEFNAPYTFTDVANFHPETVRYWKNFPCERFTRIRYMKLAAGGVISVHNDGYNDIPDGFNPLDGILPINVAIVHPDHCEMIIEDCGTVPFSPGKVFLVNVARNHMVVNKSNNDRIHLIANIILGNRKEQFCKMLVESYERNRV